MSTMTTTKKEAEEFAKMLGKLKEKGRSLDSVVFENEANRSLENANVRIKELEEALANALAEDERVKESDEIIMKKMERIQDLEEINEAHKKLNGELRQEVYDWKMKAAEVIKLNNTIQGQKQLIEELQRDNRNLAKQVDDSVNRLRKSGVI